MIDEMRNVSEESSIDGVQIVSIEIQIEQISPSFLVILLTSDLCLFVGDDLAHILCHECSLFDVLQGFDSPAAAVGCPVNAKFYLQNIIQIRPLDFYLFQF